ncbi:MAG: hypothetical protein GWP59_05120 [Chlamydiales bacterium]|nr:hypothetical protein [Chlamydiales bacterium]
MIRTALKSIFLGENGSFSLPGNIEVNFKKDDPSFAPSLGIPVLDRLLRCRPLQITALGYLHVLIHELGHAIASRSFSSHSINVYTGSCTGSVNCDSKVVTLLSGPLAGVSFRLGVIAMTVFYKESIPTPLRYALKGGSVAWMAGENLYMLTGITNNNGDWGGIKNCGYIPLASCSAAMLSVSFLAARLIVNSSQINKKKLF